MSTLYVPFITHLCPVCLLSSVSDCLKFDIDIYSDSASKQPVKELVRSKLVPQLRSHLVKLGPSLVKEHGKDIQHAPGSNPSSGFATPTYQPSKPASIPLKPAASTTSTTSGSLVNTTTVTTSDEFRTSAAELYTTFTDKDRLTAFTRSPAKLSATPPAPQTTFSLLDGNVSGTFVKLEEPTLIIQKWRLGTWPQGHFADLEIKFDQNDLDHVTVMRCTWKGVPVGHEEVVKKNWEGYFVRGMKQTFGYVDAFPQYPTKSTGWIILSFFVVTILTCIFWLGLEPFFDRSSFRIRR
jgi:activator of HSP90 ATPase